MVYRRSAGPRGGRWRPDRCPSRSRRVSPWELALTGDFISAQRAYELGLVNQVVPAGTALEAATGPGARIVANGPLAVAASKQVVASAQDWDSGQMFAEQLKIVLPVMTSQTPSRAPLPSLRSAPPSGRQIDRENERSMDY